MSARVYEAGDGVGGTWYWNRYPGARCDSESYIYCYSFSKELRQEWDWSGKYPEQPEILEYLNHVADRFESAPGCPVQYSSRCCQLPRDGRPLADRDGPGRSGHGRYLITAIGCISAGQVPDIEGLASFEGEWYHTGGWPHDGVDFAGKRVGVIGTGSSGIQSIPVIAREAAQLTVFQRTPQYTVPARHENVDRKFLEDVKANYDAIWEKARTSAGGLPVDYSERSALEASAEERQAAYEAGWAQGGHRFLFGSFHDITTDRRANDTAAEFIRARIREIVRDPDTAEKLLPRDHPFGSKRALIDTDYFETYNRDNVRLVDIRHWPIEEITATGLRTADGEEHELDIIVFATGFDAMTGSFFKMDTSAAAMASR